MNQSTAKELLLLTESMLSMAQENDWVLFSDQEKKRAQIISNLENNIGERMVTSDRETISLLERIIEINQIIHTLSLEQLDADKQAILFLNKSKKGSNVYQDL